MATYRGTGGIIKAVTTAVPAGAAAEVGEVKSWSAEFSADMLEDTAIGDTYKSFVAGLTSGTVSIEAHYWSADPAQEDLVNGAAVDLELYPMGSTGAKISCSGIVTRIRVVNEGVGGIVAYAVEVQVSGVRGT
jgi:hypothetical protein